MTELINIRRKKDQVLEDIGFYTLSDNRALNSSTTSPLARCELLLTDACNFKCPYCRGAWPEYKGTLPLERSQAIVGLWIEQGLRNVRFSGGEPTLYKGLLDLVNQCKEGGVERIALSTNGSASMELYQKLIDAGVNDFSISLDGACCAVGDQMAGVPGSWDNVVDNIREISKQTYCTVGMVFTEENIATCEESVRFAADLGVSDIRVIPSAQYNLALHMLGDLPDSLLDGLPILKYRIRNIRGGQHVRGIAPSNKDRCRLVLDDMAVTGGDHFPCIIHLREGGAPLGKVGPEMREERKAWMESHVPSEDPICSKNCLDVCVDYNRVAARSAGGTNASRS